MDLNQPEDRRPSRHPFRTDPVPHLDLADRCSFCGMAEPEHEGLMTEEQTLRASAKAHIQAKYDAYKREAREQGLNVQPMPWSAALTWLDDWTPDV